MSKRKNDSIIVLLFIFVFKLIYYVFLAIFKILGFFIDVIVFEGSGYKQKSGNGFFKYFFDKGIRGEFSLYKKVANRFGKENVLVNIYLPSTTIDTTEIDVLAISKKCIYCFEMKNYSGYIFGSEENNNWTHVLNKRTKYSFYNPIRQNKAHQKSLQEVLKISGTLICPIVLFSNKATLSKVKTNSSVLRIRDLTKFIDINETNSTNLISEETRKQYIEALSKFALVSDKVKKEHIEQINKAHYHKER